MMHGQKNIKNIHRI